MPVAESEIRYRRLFESIKDGILILDAKTGKIMDVNPFLIELLGYPLEKIVEKTILEIGFFKDIAINQTIFLKLQQKEYVRYEDLLVETADGRLINVEFVSNMYSVDHHSVIQCNIRDISERKRMKKELWESEMHLHWLIEGTTDYAIYVLDTDGNVVNWNSGAERLKGYIANEIIGKPFSLFFTPEDQQDGKPQRLLATAEFQGRSEEEGLRVRKDGSSFWANGIITPLRNDDGSLYGFVKITRDISERKLAEEKMQLFNTELEKRVNQRTAQLQAVNEELEAFSYSVSHDLRAPLRHTSGYVELLAKRYKNELSEKGQHYLDAISDSVHQMGKLIDDLLQFSRTGREELHESVLDMNLIVKEVSKQLQLDNPLYTINWDIGALPSAFGDNAMIHLVWINLLSNAIKFSRTRKNAIIEIGANNQDKETIFYVRDNGVGFDMQYAQKLFGVFQRLHPIEEFEGTGIGLANVKRIILRHGGRTWAEAEPDKGATFYFSLPKMQPHH